MLAAIARTHGYDAEELDAKITVDEFHTLNSCLDDAIAEAVTEYSRLREKSLTAQENADAGAVREKLNSYLDTALAAFDVLESGAVAIGGSTGALLGRSLRRMKELTERSQK